MPSPTDHGDPWVIMNKTTQSDGMGGYFIEWTEGAEFIGLATTDNTATAVMAEKTAAYIRLKLQVDKSVPVDVNSYIKRQFDGATFLVKSDPSENQTPTDASLSFKQFDIVKAPLPIA